MFDWVLSMSLLRLKNKKTENMKMLKLYSSFLWMEFNCIKATELLQWDSLLFTTQS